MCYNIIMNMNMNTHELNKKPKEVYAFEVLLAIALEGVIDNPDSSFHDLMEAADNLDS